MPTSDFMKAFKSHEGPPDHDPTALFMGAMARHLTLTGSTGAPALHDAIREVAARGDISKAVTAEDAASQVYAEAHALWSDRVAAGQTGKPAAGPMSRRDAEAAVSADPAWQADSKGLYDFVVHAKTGEKLTHAQLHARSRNADGSFNASYDEGFINAATAEYRARVDALLTGSVEPPKPAESAPSASPAPPVGKPAPTASGAPDLSLAAARALADLPPPKTEAPTAPAAREPTHAEISASWGRTVERQTADMATTLSPGKVDMVTPGPGYGHDVGQRDDTAAVRAEAADPLKAAQSWGRVIGKLSTNDRM